MKSGNLDNLLTKLKSALGQFFIGMLQMNRVKHTI